MPDSSLAPLALIRFSALGDVASAARVAFEARQRWPMRRIVFVTHARYRPLLDCLAAPVEVLGLGDEVQGVAELGRRLRRDRFEVVDLHRSLRTTLLYGHTPTLTWRRLDKMRGKRRALIRGRRDAIPETYRVQRAQADLLGLELSQQPWLVGGPAEASDLTLVPGAAWPEKRWPCASFAAVAKLVSASRRVRVLYSATDGLPIENLDWGSAELCGDLDLNGCINVLSRSKMVLSNDTGFAHIAEGLGVPTRVFIGPTDQRLGAAPQSDFPQAQALHLGLDCQPCSQKGDRPCHVGGRPCLAGWLPQQVADLLQGIESCR